MARARAALAAGLVAGAAIGCATLPGDRGGSLQIVDAASLDPALRTSLEAAGARAQAERHWPPEDLLRELADAGYLQGAICRTEAGGWTVDPRSPADSIHLRWASADGAADLEPGWTRSVPARGGDLAARLEEEIHRVLQRCADVGYPLAAVRIEAASCDDRPELCLRLELGRVVRVTDVAFQGPRVTRASYLRRLVGWRGPETYRGERWDEARGALAASGLFESIEGPQVLLAPGGGSAPPETLATPLLFRLRERQVNQIRGLLGYADRAGQGRGTLNGYVDLTLGNLFGTGRSMHALWEGLGDDRSRVELAWHEPYLWKLPLAADLSLRHFQEDTLYAQTAWAADLVWRPVPDWRVAIGYGGERLVLGGEIDDDQGREASRFGIARRTPEPDPWRDDWALHAEVVRATGEHPLRRATLTLAEQVTRARWGLWLEQQAGLLSGADSLLRSDVFRVGGAASLRGSLEGEYFGRLFLLQRSELGRRLDRAGARAYLLADFGWIEVWEASASGVYGTAGPRRFLGAWGAGLDLPSRAGRIRLEFAVPHGAGLGRGRIHLGLDSAF